MNIEVNGKPTEVADGATLQTLAETMQLPGHGVAVAVNNRMVPRPEWGATLITEGTKILIIKAACGG